MTGQHQLVPNGVLGSWASTWLEASDAVRQDLHHVLGVLDDERRTPDSERTRSWLITDWLIRAAAPRWLRSIGLTDHARSLRELQTVGSRHTLGVVAPVVDLAAEAAYRIHEKTWYKLAKRAQTGAAEHPARSQVWMSLVEGTQDATRIAWVTVEPAARATGYPTSEDAPAPPAWHSAVATIWDAAAALGWHATDHLTGQPGWSWDTPPATARAQAHITASAALAGPHHATQDVANQLLEKLTTLIA